MCTRDVGLWSCLKKFVCLYLQLIEWTKMVHGECISRWDSQCPYLQKMIVFWKSLYYHSPWLNMLTFCTSLTMRSIGASTWLETWVLSIKLTGRQSIKWVIYEKVCKIRKHLWMQGLCLPCIMPMIPYNFYYWYKCHGAFLKSL